MVSRPIGYLHRFWFVGVANQRANVKEIQVVAAELEQGPQGLQVRRPKHEGNGMDLCSVFVCFSCLPSFYNFHA